MICAKIIPSLEKCLPGTDIKSLPTLERITLLKGERLSFQLAVRAEEDSGTPKGRLWCPVTAESDLGKINIRSVEYTPVVMPVYPDPSLSDDDYISKEPGLYPDRLDTLKLHGSHAAVCTFQTRSIWFDIDVPASAYPGEHDIKVSLRHGDNTCENVLKVKVIDAILPEDGFLVTQWFHCDCLADYYNVEVFSDEHWKIIENFARTAVRNGINTLLTPVFTPPLDTAVGEERRTVQLVGVKKRGNKYKFDYKLLDRWVEMCDRIGIKKFEISHLFTQWGAAHAPKVMGYENGKYRKLFGWETDATGEEYRTFLRAFLIDFTAHMKKRGNDKRCIFHISDEPNTKNIEQYTASRNSVADLLEGYTCMDALSHIEFWETGVVKTPVAAVNKIQPFIDKKVPGLWAYYCCGQSVGVSNRFLAMPGARTRFIGTQFYKYDISGFLQWGYNFYYNQGSYDQVDPYSDASGDYFVPAGDTYSVYPGKGGVAIESMRICQFYEGLQDMRALELCEKLCGRENTEKLIDDYCGGVSFDKCICDSMKLIALRDMINDMIEKNL